VTEQWQQDKINRLWENYNTDGNLFSDEIQMNYVDAELLSIIENQQAAIEALTTRLTALEVATGLRVPEPLPETLSAPAAFVERVLGLDEEMREGDMIFSDGEFFDIVKGLAGETPSSFWRELSGNKYTVTRREPAPVKDLVCQHQLDEERDEYLRSMNPDDFRFDGLTRFVDGAPDEQSAGDGQRLEEVF